MSLLLLFVLCMTTYQVMAMNTTNKHLLRGKKIFVHMGEGYEISNAIKNARVVLYEKGFGENIEEIDSFGNAVNLLDKESTINKITEWSTPELAEFSISKKRNENKVTLIVRLVEKIMDGEELKKYDSIISEDIEKMTEEEIQNLKNKLQEMRNQLDKKGLKNSNTDLNMGNENDSQSNKLTKFLKDEKITKEYHNKQLLNYMISSIDWKIFQKSTNVFKRPYPKLPDSTERASAYGRKKIPRTLKNKIPRTLKNKIPRTDSS